MNKRIVILFGPPGAGKGTQSELLKDKLGLFYFETSRILERTFKQAENFLEDSSKRYIEVDGEKYDILNEKKLWLEGILCSPPYVSYLVKKEIRDLAEQGESLILAGSPRTVYEGENIIPLLKELYGNEIKTVVMEISPEETIHRNSNRRLCELMRHPILYTEETKDLMICPLDGSKLIKREGLDDPESIKVRLDEYKNRTYPVLEILERNDIEVIKINGEQSPADVHKDILSAIK